MNYPDESREYVPLYENRREQLMVFFLVAVGIFTITYGVLFLFDFLPEAPASGGSHSTQTATTTGLTVVEDPAKTAAGSTTPQAAEVDPYPREIIFDSLGGRVVPVNNPESTKISALDNSLLTGAVRHPESADFVNTGTIFLFGHSSYLPKVINKNFQNFNGIQNLEWGDTIRLRSSDTEYVYRVDKVYKTKASDAEVAIERGTPKLTLATCNSFGSKDDRYVVESTLVDSYLLGTHGNGQGSGA
jgi:LPXTG-site transpeptidase (sortase) family protein